MKKIITLIAIIIGLTSNAQLKYNTDDFDGSKSIYSRNANPFASVTKNKFALYIYQRGSVLSLRLVVSIGEMGMAYNSNPKYTSADLNVDGSIYNIVPSIQDVQYDWVYVYPGRWFCTTIDIPCNKDYIKMLQNIISGNDSKYRFTNGQYVSYEAGLSKKEKYAITEILKEYKKMGGEL